MPTTTSFGGSGISSVSGALVDNSDPQNPIIEDKACIVMHSNNTLIDLGFAADPSFFEDAVVDFAKGVQLTDAATGTVRNVSGRVLNMMGFITVNPRLDSGGNSAYIIISETSPDDINWVGNLDSKRRIELTNTSETVQTKSSKIIGWQPNHDLRFRFFKGSGNISFRRTAAAALGQTFTTDSISWSMREL